MKTNQRTRRFCLWQAASPECGTRWGRKASQCAQRGVALSIALAIGGGLLAGCSGNGGGGTPVATATPSPTVTPSFTATSSFTATPSPTVTSSPPPTPSSTVTSSSTPTPTPSSTATSTATPTGTTSPTALLATSSSVIAVDCARQRAYVPLDFLNDALHGQVAVLDLSVDPDQGDPLVASIDLGIVELPRAAAVSIKSGTVLVLTDNVLNTGHLVLIDESNLSITSFPFPAGSRPDETDGVVIDPNHDTALVSMNDSVNDCTGGAGSCTGQAVFDLTAHSFGPLIVVDGSIDNFALDAASDVSLAASDTITPLLYAVDLPSQSACTLDDANISTLDADPDGIAVDPSTNIWVVGNFESPLVTVLNLNDSSFTSGPDCVLTEGGTSPNSVNHNTQTHAVGMPGAVINPVTHQALITAESDNQIALLNLPSTRITQLTAASVTSVHSTIPNDPLGNVFHAADFPYAAAIDGCHNLGYVLQDMRGFLVQIDLDEFGTHPVDLSAPLPAGTCAAAATSFQCDNGSGIKFFPLPGFADASARSLRAEHVLATSKMKKHARTRR
jgi:hypothetical protein